MFKSLSGALVVNLSLINAVLSFLFIAISGLLFSEIPSSFLFILVGLSFFNLVLDRFYKKLTALMANILAALCLIALFVTVGISDTVKLFVSMMLLASTFKLLQAKAVKHYQTVCLLVFFNLSTVYLFYQGILETLLVSLLYIINFAVLGYLSSPKSPKSANKQSIKTVLLALPVSVFLIIFLPKLPAFWQLPGPKLAKTGLSEQVDPFAIAKLAESDDLVFRVEEQPNSTLQAPYYWRSLIHDAFDGQQWLVSDILKSQQFNDNRSVNIEEPKVEYNVIAEPSSSNWLFALGFATSSHNNVASTYNGLLKRKGNLNKNIKYAVRSTQVSYSLTPFEQRLYTQLPVESNPKTRELVNNLANKNTTAQSYFNALLGYFNTQQFSYTLTPTPMLNKNTIDQFVFENKSGFCGHYASTAAFMFRAAGYPARVVSGYLGAERQGKTLNIYQYDAHAWVEVFYDERWHVFDATEVVAPERLNGSLSEFQALSERFNDNLNFGLKRWSHLKAINWLRIKLEELDYKWTNWVLTFDEQSQQNLFKALFGNNAFWLTPLVIMVTLALCFTSYFLYSKRLPRSSEPLVFELMQLYRWAEKQQIHYDETNTPLQNIALMKRSKPTVASKLAKFEQIFIEVRYQQQAFNQNRKKQVRLLLHSIKTAK
ncbi:MAG: transglutaminase [Pseudoalteromonadaceae bacterium]|nr:transglutaminase [Pseudoalteromonadaceae bacterium]